MKRSATSTLTPADPKRTKAPLSPLQWASGRKANPTTPLVLARVPELLAERAKAAAALGVQPEVLQLVCPCPDCKTNVTKKGLPSGSTWKIYEKCIRNPIHTRPTADPVTFQKPLTLRDLLCKSCVSGAPIQGVSNKPEHPSVTYNIDNPQNLSKVSCCVQSCVGKPKPFKKFSMVITEHANATPDYDDKLDIDELKCNNCHAAENGITKVCNHCPENGEQPITAFYSATATVCKSCTASEKKKKPKVAESAKEKEKRLKVLRQRVVIASWRLRLLRVHHVFGCAALSAVRHRPFWRLHLRPCCELRP